MATATRERSRDSKGYGTGTGAIVGAAVAGAAVGVAATIGRKLFVQFASGAAGDWLEALKAEHQAALALLDKLQATDSSQTMIRSHPSVGENGVAFGVLSISMILALSLGGGSTPSAG